MHSRATALALACLLALPASAGALDKDNPFDAAAVCPSAPVPAGGGVDLVVEFQVFSHDFFIYRDMSDILVDDPAGLSAGQPIFPKGELKYDRVSERDREIYGDTFRATLPLQVPPGTAPGSHFVKLRAKYQGCNKPENYCLFPTKKELSCDVVVLGGPAPAGAGGQGEPGQAAAGGSGEAATPSSEGGGAHVTTPDGDATAPETTEAAGSGATSGGDAVIPPATAAGGPGGKAPISTRPLATPGVASPACAGEAGEGRGLVARVTAWLTGRIEGAAGRAKGPGLLFLVLVFLGGVASSLTPCVYPMIPITVSVIGASADKDKLRSFLLSVVYVLGIAVTYTVLGLAAARSGGMFGAALQNPWVLAAVAAVMLALSASMFGAWEIALPSSLASRAGSVGAGGGFASAFVVGTVAGIVAAPCTGPIVLMLLGVIGAQGWGLLAGGVVMLVYSLGLGMLFLAVGTFAGALSSLPRSGAWMDSVKHLFGVVLVGAAVYYAAQAAGVIWAGEAPPAWVAPAIKAAWVATALSAAWVVGGERALVTRERSSLRCAAGLAVLALGIFLVFRPERAEEGVQWSSAYGETLAAARERGRPIILDFTADWCRSCKELEKETYTDPAVRRCASEFATVMVDGTRDTDEFVTLKERFGIKGLPAVFFMCPDGTVVSDLTLKGFDPPGSFLEKMNVALRTCREG